MRGFTLLEVLVALAIIAVALSAIIKTTGDAVRNTAYLQHKTLAHWIGLNLLTEVQISGEYPSPGTKTGTEDMADQSWDWKRIVKATPQAGIRQVEIEVRLADNEDSSPLDTVIGYVAEPQAAPATTTGGAGARTGQDSVSLAD